MADHAVAINVEAAAADGLVPLPLDGRRHHVHYTHVRTANPEDAQPSQLTREQFWQHLLKCYQEIYHVCPRIESPPGPAVRPAV